PRRLAFAAAAAAAVVLGVFLVAPQLDGPVRRGQVELEAVLVPPDGGSERATVVVEKTGIGREVSFRSDDLPILPQGEYYELWFVGPGDTRRRPNRISAGTFHPDEQGRSLVELTAAVDPKLYPVLSVTAEPADGNPERTGPEVLRSRSE
ncbi:MAG: anti-sigma factor, partial [Gaiellaceae bacterium]